jgi:hypothetical protein
MWVSRRFARSAWTVVAILFSLAAPVAQLTHGVLVAHRFCAQHFAVEDSHGQEADGSSPHGDDGSLPAGEESHEACLLLSLRATAPSLSAPWGEQRPVPEVTSVGPGPMAEAPAAASLILSLAPKTSPPRS